MSMPSIETVRDQARRGNEILVNAEDLLRYMEANERLDDTAGRAAARRYARWNIGDASWADGILTAYADPAGTQRRLDEEEGE